MCQHWRELRMWLSTRVQALWWWADLWRCVCGGGELVHMRLKTIIILKASCWGQRQNKNHETNVTGKAAVPLLQCWRLSKWDIRSSGLWQWFQIGSTDTRKGLLSVGSSTREVQTQSYDWQMKGVTLTVCVAGHWLFSNVYCCRCWWVYGRHW